MLRKPLPDTKAYLIVRRPKPTLLALTMLGMMSLAPVAQAASIGVGADVNLGGVGVDTGSDVNVIRANPGSAGVSAHSESRVDSERDARNSGRSAEAEGNLRASTAITTPNASGARVSTSNSLRNDRTGNMRSDSRARSTVGGNTGTSASGTASGSIGSGAGSAGQ